MYFEISRRNNKPVNTLVLTLYDDALWVSSLCRGKPWWSVLAPESPRRLASGHIYEDYLDQLN